MVAHYDKRAACGAAWAMQCAVTAIVVLAAFMSGWSLATEPAWAADPSRVAVRLVIDYGDGVEKHFTNLAWHERATVFAMMEAAMKHPRGIDVKYRGKGATLLIMEIDGLKGEATGAGSRNWIYRVNGQIGGRSAGIMPVKAGDTVLWSFESYR